MQAAATHDPQARPEIAALHDRAETLSRNYLALAHDDAREALRLLAVHALEDQEEHARALNWYVSRGYVRAALVEGAAARA